MRTRIVVTLVAVAGLIVGVLAPTAAIAGPGSLVSGTVWADTNRDGLRQPSEPVRTGVTVQLLTSPGGAVAGTTTTSASGAYSFADAPDGNYIVRVDAPGAFVFPATASGDNDFSRAGQPLPGQPERGVTAAFPITGAAQVMGVDAGLQPTNSLQVERLPMDDACDGVAQTGKPPFDATDGPGLDSGTANCVIRAGDQVFQQYGVSLSGLSSGASAQNVVLELRISSADGAALALTGTGANGIPGECLTADVGANPPSSRTLNPDGSITVYCNVGTLSSTAAGVPLSWEMTEDSAIPSHASVEAFAYAAGGEAAVSNTVSGPVVEVTGRAEWELEKLRYTGGYHRDPGPSFTALTIAGVQHEGYLVRYEFNITDMLAGAGGAALDWPVTFTDVMPEFPGARITECRRSEWYDPTGESLWQLGCPGIAEVQGADGWQLSIQPQPNADPNHPGYNLTEGHMIMTVFIPLDEMNRAIDPSWQPGDPVPTGTFDFDNRAQGTDHWAMNGGALNYGDGHEPGWDGTGDNLAIVEAEAEAPQWDLQKYFFGGPFFSTQTINGQQVDGYFIDYDLRIVDLAGPDNVGPWLDRPVTFKDRLVSHPGAVLLSCRPWAVGDPARENGTATCETGAQPSDGWDMSFVPNQSGFERRQGDFIARVFIPMDQLPSDPCDTNITIDLRNEAIDSQNWTVEGQPNNGTGFEPGWDGTVATGNNVDQRSIRPASSQCGTLTGNKNYIRNGSVINFPTFGGDIVQSFVSLEADNARVTVEDLRLCDVFDVSVLKLVAGSPRMGTFTGNNVNPADFVIEYAIGPNAVNTQTGPRGPNGIFPADASSIVGAAGGCRDHPGPWSTNPAADFGADWQDRVNMVRVRPIDLAHVETGPFGAHLIFELEVRTFYNGGPNATEAIPSGVLLTNVGAWPTGRTGAGWTTTPRQIVFSGMRLNVDKQITPTQYLPGTRAVWDLSVWIDRATVGATMRNLRVVDTLPADLHFDLACTQGFLPPGVTVTYDAQTRQATFQAGDIGIVNAPIQTVFGPAANATHGRLRICTTVDSLAQPGDTYVNRVQVFADNSETSPTDLATIQAVGSGQLGITKSVDKQLVASGEDYRWSVEWGNTSTSIVMQPPDVIDVLPWNGDGDPTSGSARTQFPSDYTGLAQLTGPLAPPTYLRGGTGSVLGTWYYSVADPSTINHDPRDPSNVDPAAPGGLWRTAAEITVGAGFEAVTAIRFVSSTSLPVQSRVRATIEAVSTSNDLDNVYVNRAMIFSGTFPDQPLESNEPYVLMPGFTLGDLVWIDPNGNGRFDVGEQGVAGVTVQVLDADGNAVATRVTDANGRWSVAALPEGTYTAFIPPSMFLAGAPLADHVVRLVGSRPDEDINENVDNNNTDTPDPAVTGLTSSPVTLEYVYDNGQLVGANGPTGDDVAGLGGELLPDVFTNFTVDLALLPAPAIDIEKATNGQDADTPAGPNVTVGGAVRWMYVVTNTGGVDLTNVTVSDNLVDAAGIDCAGTGSNVIPGPLAPEASFTCVATGTATAGQYANTGTVTGLDPTVVEVTDEDPSHYFGIEPSVDIEKATNGQDADTPTGPLVTVGGAVRWTYVVTNTGNAPLTNVTVTDDVEDAAEIDCAGTGGNVVPGPLAAGASFTCVANGTATLGQYANLGTVVGTAPETTDVDGNSVPGVTVDDEDPSHYLGITPAVDIEKATNGQDADTPNGPLVPSGSEVTWTYVVTNTGSAPLTSVTVTDDQVAASAIDCDGTGSNVIPGPLAVGEGFECVATGPAIPGQYANLGTVVGTGPETTDVDGETVAGQLVSDEDPSHYFGLHAAIDIEKATNGQDADDAPGVPLTVGDVVEWTYVVTNTGNVPLVNVTVTDDKVAASEIWCDGTESNVVAGPLAPGASVTCNALGVATAGAYLNTGTVTGESPDLGITVTDDDPSHYTAAVPPAPAALPSTGAALPVVGLAGGGLMALLGLLIVVATRRRRT